MPPDDMHPVPPVPQKVRLFTEELRSLFSTRCMAASQFGCEEEVGPQVKVVGWPCPGHVEIEIRTPQYLNHVAVYKLRVLIQKSHVGVKPPEAAVPSSVRPQPAAAGEPAAKRARRHHCAAEEAG